jgi:hypothetical protein
VINFCHSGELVTRNFCYPDLSYDCQGPSPRTAMSSAYSSLKPTSSCRPRFLDPSQPIKSLSIGFWVWKALLFVIIIGCPGLGYDSSSSLLPFQSNGSVDVIASAEAGHTLLPIPLKFVRWDSIYFVHIARNGYVFEQEWAFSYVYSNLVDLLSSCIWPLPPSVSQLSVDAKQHYSPFSPRWSSETCRVGGCALPCGPLPFRPRPVSTFYQCLRPGHQTKTTALFPLSVSPYRLACRSLSLGTVWRVPIFFSAHHRIVYLLVLSLGP